MPTRRRFGSLARAALLAVAACGDVTAPGTVPGTYTLQRLGPEPLPVSLGGTAGSGFTALLAETLRLDAAGTAHLESQRHHGAGYGSSYSLAETYDYTVVGDGTWARRGDTVVVSLGYSGDRSPFALSSSYAGTLRLRAPSHAGGELTEYQNLLSSSSYVRGYVRSYGR